MAVIKQAGCVAAVRRLVGQPPLIALSVDPRDDAIAALGAERDALAAELAAAQNALALAQAEAHEAVAAAREEALADGHRAGLAAAEMHEGDRVVAIARGITAEATRLDERFASIDGLAAALVRACLDRVFARPDAMAAMVTDALKRHLATLRDGAMLSVRVSGADFADTAALEAAVREAGGRAIVAVDLDLPAGACRIDARLGRIDLDVPAQWATLARHLDEMAVA